MVTLANVGYLHTDITGDACTACRGRVIAGSFYITTAGLILKGIFGFLCGSRALIADAMHGLADTLCFGINYIGSRAAPTSQQKADLGGNRIIGSVIIISGVWVFADSTAAIASGTLARPGLFGFIVAAISTIVNWRLYRMSECLKKRFDDPPSFVCAVQNKTNFHAACLSLAGVLLADAGFKLFDPVCAVIIGSYLIVSGLKILNEAFEKRGPLFLSIRRNTMLAVGILSCFIVAFYAYRVTDNLSHNKVILIPAQGTTIASPVDAVLGRAQYFIIMDLRANTMTLFSNEVRLYNADVSNNLVAIVRDKRVDAVIAYKIGTEMFADLQAEGVKMYYVNEPTTVERVISDYQHNRLEVAMVPNVSQRYGQIGWLRPW